MEKYIPQELIHKYQKGLCSEKEQALVESWHIKDLEESNHVPSRETISIVHERTWKKLALHTNYHENNKKKIRLWTKLVGAASILIAVSTFIFTYYLNQQRSIVSALNTVAHNDISPGGDKAILTFENGKKTILDDHTSDLVIMQGNVKVSKSEKGMIVYYKTANTKVPEIMNKLETPRGGKYKVVLPDGTKVWLNAASILSYPISFNGKSRTVELKGEAYFEVAKDQSKPFKVITATQIVEVLGTHFNINAYPDEIQTATTLLEGSISLIKGPIRKTIKPGQVALNSQNSNTIRIEQANIEKNVAWKNNEFIFDGEDLNSIIKILSRWYNVEIIYKGSSNQTKYWGVVSRSKNLSEALKMLQATGKVNFKIQGRRVILMD